MRSPEISSELDPPMWCCFWCYPWICGVFNGDELDLGADLLA